MHEIGEELERLALEAVDTGLDIFTGDEPYPFLFIADMAGETHTIRIAPRDETDGAGLVDVLRHALAVEIGHDVQRYALAYDGYLTTDGKRSDAVFVEAGERGQREAFLIAQRYLVKKKSGKIERLDGPTIIRAAEQLLGDG